MIKILFWSLVGAGVGYGVIYAFVYFCPPLPHL